MVLTALAPSPQLGNTVGANDIKQNEYHKKTSYFWKNSCRLSNASSSRCAILSEWLGWVDMNLSECEGFFNEMEMEIKRQGTAC
jgi:hypothetical protein